VYVAVYNNDVYLQERAYVTLQARWSLPGGAPLCAANCSSNGVCAAPGSCKCFAGEFCKCQLCKCQGAWEEPMIS